MKYVALLSGGKDSCYNLLHCAQNCHQLVAAASLGPVPGKEELDSYLYQTVGQDAIELVARALDVPLYRRFITGDALDKRSEYGSRNPAERNGVRGDETEDLLELLTIVKFHHPEIQGVSVGAILSNYQRVRVEHVCRRLLLTPLCYLWQRDQSQLLSEMIDAGMESIIIKVAGIGLTTKHLGKDLATMQPTLIKLNRLYGSHVCGEGGEYETLTLNFPLFKQRITLTEVETVIHSDNDFATVAYLRVKAAVLESKDNTIPFRAHIPALLESDFIAVEDAVKSSEGSTERWRAPIPVELPRSAYLQDTGGISSKKLGRWVTIANIHRDISVNDEVSVEAEVQECFHKLHDALSQHNLNLSHCVNVNVYLSSMDLFARVNAIYATFFGSSPPARACVAVNLPPPIRFQLDCIAYAEDTPEDRQTIHVQGLSYWAPANIGPYSQTITVDERVFVSGQIGLIPTSLTLPSPRSLALEAALSFQHVKRLIDVLQSNTSGNWNGCSQSALYWLIDVEDVVHIKKAHQSYEKHPIPTLFLVVSALPKDAVVEKQVLLHTGRCIIPASDGDESSLETDTAVFAQGECIDEFGMVHWEISYFQQSGAFCAIVCVRGRVSDASFSQLRHRHEIVCSRSLSLRFFYRPARVSCLSSITNALFGSTDCPPCTVVTSHFISTVNNDDWDVAMYILGK